MCMQVPSVDVAERSIAAVAAKVGDLQPDSLRVVNVMGVCHLGHEADLDYLSLPSTLGGTYEPEIMPYWGGDVDGSTLRVWALGTVRVMSSKTAEMASAACEKLRARARREAPESNIIAI
jgi:TATA-box binding protein (TBP) (component of TFIID and TFIIIB)